ncbi:MAG: cadherin-like domain-containing protein [Anaerolineales bacterium]|nr:cadherin-like domain-containing protein [Anaerolineales bacterium]
MKHRIFVLVTVVGFAFYIFFALGTTFADAAAVIAHDDSIIVLEGGTATQLTTGATSVLVNDVTSNTLTVASIIDQPDFATAAFTVNANGTFSYKHDGSEHFSDYFVYQACDTGAVSCDTATVNISITPQNDPPTAVNDTATISENSVLSVSSPGVLSNDTDPESDPLRVTSASNVSTKGAVVNVTLNTIGNGSYTYDPTAAATLQALPSGQSTVDTFNYTISDGNGGTSNATVSITVNGQNDAPTFVSTPGTSVNEDSLYTYNIVVNDVDTGDTITISAPTLPDWLTLTPTGNGTATLSGTPTNDEALTGFFSVSLQAKDTSNSTDTQSFIIQVHNVNDAPVLDNSGNMVLSNINEDNQNPNGDVVLAIISSAGGDRITDVDANAAEGIAVVGADNTNGTWQYSTNNGSSWSNFGVVTDTSAILLNNFARIRFVPNLDYSGPAGNITFRAWDQTSGSNGSTGINTIPNGGTTAFSVATETATLTVQAINDAPVLDNTGTMVLPNINEDTLAPAGDTVANIILSAGLDRITDVDVAALEGIAVIGRDNTNGIWQYSTNGGTSWNPFGTLSENSAVLLNPAAKIRFVPNLDYNGSAGNITFRAWDQTSGSNGSTGINTVPNGGSTAFSIATETATLSVLAVNDPPVIDLNGLVDPGTGFETNFVANGGAVTIVDTDLSLVDVDHSNLAKALIAITNPWDGASESLAANTAGTSINASFNPSDATLTLSGNDTVSNYQKVLRTITYNNIAQDPDTRQRSISFIVNDGLGDSTPATALVNILNPIITLSMTPNSQEIPSGATASFDVAIKNEGNVVLTQIKTSSSINDCVKDYASLQIGETKTFTCVRNNVTESFNHTLTVSGKDPLGGTVTDNSTVTVIVENPNIRIVPTTVTPTVVQGGTVIFNITVRNPSNLTTLTNVVVTSDIPNCDNHTVGTLNPNQNKSFTCSLPNATEALTAAFTASSGNVSDTNFASFDVLALNINITPSPNEIPETGQVVDFTVEVRNEGSKDVEITKLTTDTFGNIVALPSTDCELGNMLDADGGTYACTFSTTVFGIPPSYQVELTVEAEDDTPITVSKQDTASITILAVASDINLTIEASPNSVVGPGQMVTYTLQIENASTLRDVTITALEDSLLGPLADLEGDCEMPQAGLEIAKKATFECTFKAPFAANAGEKETHIVTAQGVDENNDPVGGSAKVEIRSYRLVLPLAPKGMRTQDEPNDVCTEAYPLTYFDKEYQFLAEDVTDWYVFELDKATSVTVRVTNFAPQTGQAVIYRFDGNNCNAPSEGGSRTVIKSNGVVGTDKSVSLGTVSAGHYLVRIINDGSTTTGQKYKLTIDVP